MKRALFLTILTLTACRRPTPIADATHAFPEKPPVVDAQPVDTKSYDEGFHLGYPVGFAASRLHAKVPREEEVRELAARESANDATRNNKWRAGWAEGYLEGFRTRALNTK